MTTYYSTSETMKIQNKYFTNSMKILKMTRTDMQKIIKKLKLPIKANQKTEEIRDQILSRIRQWRDKEIAKEKEQSKVILPKISDEELNQIIEDLSTILPVKKEIKTLTWTEISNNLHKILEEYKPTFFAQAIAEYTNDKHEKYIRKQKLVTRIDDKEVKSQYINEVEKWLFEYGHLKVEDDRDWKLIHVDIEISKKLNGKSKLLRVAKYEAENCVVNIIRGYLGNKTDDIYQTLPQLKEHSKENPVYLDHESIEKVARRLNINIQTYTELGEQLNKPWHKYGTGKRAIIPMKIHEEHATIIPGKLEISQIVYHEFLKVPTTTNVVDTAYFDLENLKDRETKNDDLKPKYYTQLIDGKLIMNKAFKPSIVTKNPIDDENLAFAYIFTPEQMMYNMFKREYELTTISNETIKNIVKASEHFIGKRVLTELSQNSLLYTELDHNKNYVAYEKSPYYIGFPTNNLIPTKLEYAHNPAFYIITNIENVPDSFRYMYNYESGPIVLARPMYQFLIDNGAIITEENINYVLDGEFQQISVLDFSEKFDIPTDDKKLFRNQLIGRTITGGIKETKILKYRYTNEDEKLQMIYEAQTNNLLYGVDENHKVVFIEMKQKTKGFFNFHTYILAYAATFVMKKWIEMTKDKKFHVVAYNVDAIVIEGNYHEDSREVGAWKTGPLKEYYRSFKIDSLIHQNHLDNNIANIIVPNYDPPRNNTLITGPAGIGKSHKWKVDPLYDQIILTPTHELKNEHQQLFENTLTVHKYFQFGVADDYVYNKLRKDGKIPREHKYIIIDEFTMFTESQWNTIKRRSKNSTLIALGDFEQIRNSINDYAVTEETFYNIDVHFDIVKLERTPEAIARHSFEYGSELDKLRGLSVKEQKRMILNNKQWIQSSKKDVMENLDITNDKIIVGTHEQATRYNLLARIKAGKNNQLFPFRTVGKQPKTILLSVNTPNVFWTRKSINEKLPKGTKYEPYFAVTADSYQGKTIEDLNMIYILIDDLNREGTLYTAITRTRTSENIIILV